MFRQWLHDTLAKLYPNCAFQVLVPPDTAMGDFSTNIAMVAKKNAKEVCDALTTAGAEMIDRCEVVGPGFVNIFLKDSYLWEQLEKTEIPNEGKDRKVIVEYSSPNIAKPMHVGHLRSTVIGDALANVYEALGYEVVRWNFVGDWGTQFGKLIAAYKRWKDEDALREHSIQEMLRLYVKFHEELKTNPELESEGQSEFKKLEEGDAENRDIWECFRKLSLGEFDRMYERLGVAHAGIVVKGESDYEQELKPLIAELEQKGIAKESEGALIIELPDLPPAMLRKSDGATLYLTRDLASLKDRIAEYAPAKILYVVANQQALHFEQLFAVKDKLQLGDTETVHVKFGMVLGENGKKLATREGNTIPLQEVMDKITALAAKRNLATAQAIGIGALKYNDLRQHPYSDIVFDWDAMLDLGGNSGPYLQYTYARLASILAKAGNSKFEIRNSSLLSHPVERALMRHLLDFGYTVSQSATLYALNGLALYIYQLAELANRYYEAVRINDDDDAPRKAARLKLIGTVADTIKKGLELLGVQVLERI